MANYVVKALAALVNVEGGFAQMLMRGAPVPSNVTPDHLQHLRDQDLVTEGEAAGGLEPVYTGDLSQAVTTPVIDDPDGPGPIPAKSAAKGDWVEYAVTQRAEGSDEAEARAAAEALTKEQLIAAYAAS